MLLGCRNKIIWLPDHKLGNDKLDSFKYAIYQRPSIVRCSIDAASSMDGFNDAKERIRETFGKNELSPSFYDTAWVAMVPSRVSLNKPCFPQCLDWIVENQREDGSWGLNPSHPLLVKDSLSSTLACLLALSKWRIGDTQVERGLGFIETHGWAVKEENQISPQGFNIIFPNMINYAKELNLNLPLDPDLVNLMILKRDLTIERALKNDLKGNIENLEYFAEGLGELCNWKTTMLHQRNNGSLFDSPATTAAALIYHQHDDKCFEYLNSILELHKNWVPTIYPTKIHSCLCLVDALQNLGVDRYFKTQVKSVLDEIYRLWQQKNDEIFSDVARCAMAFRLLRMNNYEVSTEKLLFGFVNEECFFRTSRGQLASDVAILELHKASQMATHDEKDHILDKINTWTRTFMEQKLLDKDIVDSSKKEVELALRKFYATHDRVESRRYIESYEVNNFKILKAAYRFRNIENVDLQRFSLHDFNLCQARYKEELQQLKRWFEDCRLDQVDFSQQHLYTSYFLMASTLFEPEYSDARLAYAKNTMLITLVDDFFDGFACKEELHNIIELLERWDEYSTVGFHSERINIFFSALYQTIEDIAAKAEIRQGQSVKDHFIKMWFDLVKCMLMEFDWWKSKTTPSIEEYLSVACVTIGVPCVVLTTQYLLGPKLSENFIECSEVSALCNRTSMVARLHNDIRTYKREQAERSPNIVSILITQSQGTMSEEVATRQIKEMLESQRRELLGMVVSQRRGRQLPQVCRDLFWKTSKLCYCLYSHGDEFRFPEKMKNHITEVIYKPINLST
ncbi:cis-abienol synthase, chloroplastic-like isoform X2 [Nicotiana sylvestris]|uniref:Cis-abienol synthase, chloroplastic-like isoform X1 n=1 Tax=Nicotiana sylvestris TaxID=4096 RepID=A0A1U7VI63_NICSY|nr:PREDICTED: cis-abienol synthase, chloroplastic-like isoform X1 [Nicotiana sylvestris]